MAQQEDRIYDLYLTAFGRARAGISFTLEDLKDFPPSGTSYVSYPNRELAAIVQGITDGTGEVRTPASRSALHTFLDNQLK